MTQSFPICSQVPLFLFIIFSVYTMLPFQMKDAVVLSIISSLSHILAITIHLKVYSTETSYLANQVNQSVIVALV